MYSPEIHQQGVSTSQPFPGLLSVTCTFRPRGQQELRRRGQQAGHNMEMEQLEDTCYSFLVILATRGCPRLLVVLAIIQGSSLCRGDPQPGSDLRLGLAY